MSSEGDLHVGVNEVLALAGEGFLDVGHNARVHLGQSVRPVHLHTEPCPRPVSRNSVWQQEVTAQTHTDVVLARLLNIVWQQEVTAQTHTDVVLARLLNIVWQQEVTAHTHTDVVLARLLNIVWQQEVTAQTHTDVVLARLLNIVWQLEI